MSVFIQNTLCSLLYLNLLIGEKKKITLYLFILIGSQPLGCDLPGERLRWGWVNITHQLLHTVSAGMYLTDNY